jgi:sugar lactone lactonase YvrE/enterochelin esterase-like enzyme
MKSSRLGVALLLCLAAGSAVAQTYPTGPDSRPQPDVPKGEVLHDTFDRSKIFPGTTRDYWIYVPAEYRPDRPACLYVNQDGVQWNAPVVFDNLIYKKEMPVTIGVFVTPGVVKSPNGAAALDRYNRSYEYDGLGDGYARFLLEELLPAVEAKKTSDGRAIRLSKNPDDRAIGGSSSGAICAFTAAWERPDAFHRVFSAIGTYVGLRGGDRYPTLIRKFEPKPLRIFLQDGSSDQNIYAGDWWMANQTMERALTFAGYEVNHVWGEGGHSGEQGTAIFPDVMRWLWKDWPQPIRSGSSKNSTLSDLLLPGESWRLVSESDAPAAGLAVDAQGETFYGATSGRIRKIGADGKTSDFLDAGKTAEGLAFGPDGRLYAVGATRDLTAYDAQGKKKVAARGVRGRGLVVAHNGNLYVTRLGAHPGESGEVWLVRPGGKKMRVDAGVPSPSGITLSPDQSLLYVADKSSHWVYSYQIRADGSLAYKQPYYWIHAPDTAEDSGSEGLAVDTDGRLYVATRMGVQICDQAGRVNAILPAPNGPVTDVAFGGANFDTLYALSGGKMYARKLKARGAYAWDDPNKPAPPRL